MKFFFFSLFIIGFFGLACSDSSSGIEQNNITLSNQYIEQTFASDSFSITNIELFGAQNGETTPDSILISTSSMAKVSIEANSESFVIALFEFESTNDSTYSFLRGGITAQKLVFPSAMNLPNSIKGYRVSKENVFMFVETPLDSTKNELISLFRD